MLALGTWTALATIAAATVAIAALGGTVVFRAGRMWATMKHLIRSEAEIRQDVSELQRQVQSLLIDTAKHEGRRIMWRPAAAENQTLNTAEVDTDGDDDVHSS